MMRLRGTNAVYRSLLISVACMMSIMQETVEGRLLMFTSDDVKPEPNDAAAYARWLVSHSSWGVLNTLAADRGGAPFGNVASFSDGIPGEGTGTGIPYFYLTKLDPTVEYALKDQRCSFTISEHPIGTCGVIDPENPTCAKITLTGNLRLMDQRSKEAEFARAALFAKHREMKDWPESHNFEIYKLQMEDIFLINWFGGRKPLTVNQYLQWKM